MTTRTPADRDRPIVLTPAFGPLPAVPVSREPVPRAWRDMSGSLRHLFGWPRHHRSARIAAGA